MRLFSSMRLGGWLGVLLWGGFGCGADKPPAEEFELPDACDRHVDGLICSDGKSLRCESGDIAESHDCAEEGLVCSSLRGCEACRPGYYTCDGNNLMRCNDDGRGLTLVQECGERSCSERGCGDLCANAQRERSYLGCEYWPVFTLNSQLDDAFQPAVVVGNPNLVRGHVTLTKKGEVIAEADVEPGGTTILHVQVEPDDVLRRATQTVLEPDGAYHLVSTVPVIAHQFNPLLFKLERECENQRLDPQPDDGLCFSYTNDASLLLPAHALARPEDGGISYMGISRATFMLQRGEAWIGTPGFLALVAVGSAPTHVTLHASAHTLPSEDGFPALAPGDRYEFDLHPGAVLQLVTAMPQACPGTVVSAGGETLCDAGRAYDLTGTLIQADGPLQVIGGHDCTYVPFDKPACDHLEESLFPFETWGRRVLVGKPRDSERSRYALRVISGADDNRISFTPQIVEPVTLQRGEWYELLLEKDVLVEGDEPLAVAQYLLGQNAFSDRGDPSFTLAPPVEQYRDRYDFLSPATYETNYVTIIAPVGDKVQLDADTVAFAPLGDTGYAIATERLAKPGDHSVVSETGLPVGITLYGVGAWTSYMLPGGLDLRVIADPF